VVSWLGEVAVVGEEDGRGGGAPAEEEVVDGELVAVPQLVQTGGEGVVDSGAPISPASTARRGPRRRLARAMEVCHGVGAVGKKGSSRENGGGVEV
jgi:hypothetical protein